MLIRLPVSAGRLPHRDRLHLNGLVFGHATDRRIVRILSGEMARQSTTIQNKTANAADDICCVRYRQSILARDPLGDAPICPVLDAR
jgi:hypothetical protein